MDTGHKWHSTGKCIRTPAILIYINDLPENVNSTVYMYADDTKIYREIKSEYDHGILQRDLENLKTWSDRWLLKFHPSK